MRKDSKRIDLALQGGGSHGAFTWGVLDALPEDGRFEFEAVTGASAGAMNAAVMADGWFRLIPCWIRLSLARLFLPEYPLFRFVARRFTCCE